MRYRSLLVVVTAAVVCSPSAQAQEPPLTFLHKFYSGPRVPSGRLVETADGSLFGTTACGGEPDSGCQGGSIFALRPQADGSWTYETIHNLRPGFEGSNPVSGLTVARDGSLYGIATAGGLPRSQAWGTIFRVSPSGSVAPVYVFEQQDSLRVDEKPIGRVTEASDGNLYGSTCQQGGSGPNSRLFRLTPSGSFTTIYSFPRSLTEPVIAESGMCPVTQLHEAADGFLYGTTVAGGTIASLFPPQGTIFRIDPRVVSPSVSVLHTFRGFDGAVPNGGLAAGSSGELFGTAAAGGSFGQGVVFRRDQSGAVTTLHTFNGSNGSIPFGGLFRSPDGLLFGTTLGGGLGHGTVFRVGPSGTTRLHAFSGTDGSIPIEVMRASDGDLYGVTSLGGPAGGGTVFRVGADNTVSTVHAFVPGARSPDAGVIQASDGNFYGTTAAGGRGGGTIFMMTPSGDLTILHEFAPPLWAPPTGSSIGATGLLEAADGFLYGRTAFGGVHDLGTIFRMSRTGAFTVLHDFDQEGGFEGLIQGADGNFYGLTSANSAQAGTLFRMEPTGAFTTVYTFGSPGDLSPIGPLAEGDDGAFYGVAFGSGAFNIGGLFRITKTGAFSVVHSFESSPTIGYRPVRGLIPASGGGFYGVTTFTVSSSPSVYHLDPTTNAVTRVCELRESNDASVVQTADGALYGWALVPEFPQDRYMYFRCVDGTTEFFYEPPASADGRSASSLIQGADGALYGTMARGPSSIHEVETWAADAFAGGVFRLAIPPKK